MKKQATNAQLSTLNSVSGVETGTGAVDQGVLFGRIWKVLLGVKGHTMAWDISDLDIDIRATKNLKPEPNTCELKIYNLGESLRNDFRNTKGNSLLVQMGYKGVGLSTVYQGDVRSAWSEHDGPDWITTVRSGDGETAIKARISLSFGDQISFGDAMKLIAKKMGLKPGNLDAAISQLHAISGTAEIFPNGVALTGNAWRELNHIARSAGMEVSIQDGAVQALLLHKPLNNPVVLISKDSGMLQSPEVNADGRVSVTTLINPMIKPGSKIKIDSTQVQGGYRVEECEIIGQSRGESWEMRLTCRRY